MAENNGGAAAADSSQSAIITDPSSSHSQLSDFSFLCQLGKGSFGSVYKVRRKKDQSLYCVKQIVLTGLSEKGRKNAINEVKILASLDHPYIIRYYDAFFAGEKLNIVMELAENGNLYNYLKKQSSTAKKLPEDAVWRIFLQICIGVYHIHQKSILHRDLKSLNILLDKDSNMKIGDLGCAKILDSGNTHTNSRVGTPYYLSPEMCEKRPYNDRADIWALGVILYECSTYKHPFDKKDFASLVPQIIRGKYQPISTTYSRNLSDMIRLLLTKDPNTRPDISAVLFTPFLVEKAKDLSLPMPSRTFTSQPGNEPRAESTSNTSGPKQGGIHIPSTTPRPVAHIVLAGKQIPAAKPSENGGVEKPLVVAAKRPQSAAPVRPDEKAAPKPTQKQPEQKKPPPAENEQKERSPRTRPGSAPPSTGPRVVIPYRPSSAAAKKPAADSGDAPTQVPAQAAQVAQAQPANSRPTSAQPNAERQSPHTVVLNKYHQVVSENRPASPQTGTSPASGAQQALWYRRNDIIQQRAGENAGNNPPATEKERPTSVGLFRVDAEKPTPTQGTAVDMNKEMKAKAESAKQPIITNPVPVPEQNVQRASMEIEKSTVSSPVPSVVDWRKKATDMNHAVFYPTAVDTPGNPAHNEPDELEDIEDDDGSSDLVDEIVEENQLTGVFVAVAATDNQKPSNRVRNLFANVEKESQESKSTLQQRYATQRLPTEAPKTNGNEQNAEKPQKQDKALNQGRIIFADTGLFGPEQSNAQNMRIGTRARVASPIVFHDPRRVIKPEEHESEDSDGENTLDPHKQSMQFSIKMAAVTPRKETNTALMKQRFTRGPTSQEPFGYLRNGHDLYDGLGQLMNENHERHTQPESKNAVNAVQFTPKSPGSPSAKTNQIAARIANTYQQNPGNAIVSYSRSSSSEKVSKGLHGDASQNSQPQTVIIANRPASAQAKKRFPEYETRPVVFQGNAHELMNKYRSHHQKAAANKNFQAVVRTKSRNNPASDDIQAVANLPDYGPNPR